MRCNNTLLIKYSSIVLEDNNNLYKKELSSSILYKGVIIDNEKFCEEYLKLVTKNKLSKIFWNKDIKIIYNVLNNKKDVINIYNIFKDLNYRNVRMYNEKEYIKLSKTCNYLIIDKLLKLFYIDSFNTKKELILDPEVYHNIEIKNLILNRCKNKDLIIIGKFLPESISEKINYYYFENFDEFFLKNQI